MAANDRDTGLVDAQGRRIIVKELAKEHSAPTLTGVRTIWNETVASGLTPVRLAGLLRDAAEGDHNSYLTLAEEMEERDLHYAAELSKRKLAVARLPMTVESYSDDAKDKEMADAVRALLRQPGHRSMLKDCLDALGKGYSVTEIIWQFGKQWRPQHYEWRDPRFFQFDQVSMRQLRLRDEADMVNGIELAPYKYIVHIHRMKSGIPIRGGLARLAAWSFMCKSYTIKDWLAFAEVFGMPLRLGKYGSTAKDDEISILKTAVANLGTDAAAVFPESMQVELVEAGNKGGSADFFQRLANYLDDQVSKGVLGQTASSSGTPGKLGDEKLQSEVRDDIRDDDAEQLEETLNRDLVKPFIDLNFGPQENYPELQLRAIPAENVKAIVDAVKELVPMGFKVEQSVMRDKIGLPDPDPKATPEDLLGAADKASLYEYHFKYGAITVNEVRDRLGLPPVPGGNKLITVAEGNEGNDRAPNHDTARNAELNIQGQAEALLADNLAERANGPMTGWVRHLRKLTEQATDLQELLDMAGSAFPDMDSETMATVVGQEMMRSLMSGRYDVQEEDNGR